LRTAFLEPILLTHARPLWKVIKKTNIRPKPKLTASLTASFSEGALIEEIGKDGDWVQHSRGWSLTYSNVDQLQHVIRFIPLDHSQKGQVQVQMAYQGSVQTQPVVYTPQQAPLGYQPQVQGYPPTYVPQQAPPNYTPFVQPFPSQGFVPPQGQFVLPQGQIVQPQGQFIQPQGQFVPPQGQVVQPQGQFMQPQGQAQVPPQIELYPQLAPTQQN